MNNVLRLGLLVVCLALGACISKAPATHYYALFPLEDMKTNTTELGEVAIGVGPVILPEYLENPSVVSVTASQRVHIAAHHAWAGKLHDAIARVLADNLGRAWGRPDVWAFPWDTRARPDYQVRVEFERLDGERGKALLLQAKWQLLQVRSQQVLSVGRESLSVDIQGAGIADYVAALNQAINEFSIVLAVKLGVSPSDIDSL